MATTASPGVGAVVAAGLAPTLELTPSSAVLSEVQYAAVSVGTIGVNTLVPGVTGKRIRVLALALVASGGINTATLTSGTAGPALTDPMDLASDGQLILPWNPAGWGETTTGDRLALTLTAANTVAGLVTYVTVEI